MVESKLSAAMEDYIETILLLERKNKVARVSDIGREMEVKKASVVSAVNLLRKFEFIQHEKYGYISLTDRGREIAVKIYHKHEVLLDFHENVLKVEHHTASEEACMIEHSLSQETVEKLLEYIKAVRKVDTEKKAEKNAKHKGKIFKRT
jgi:DtxR family Mn-dependent transcriptional regulator